ncbi:MAG TPA: acetyl-CoA carboxylase biotin carboxyl carrier protein [Candidatus Mediterraneibacter intestinavium]|nr:acetyl-CoA carboxylase biotin carboxyl carrier protein [Candidatus Mediterraneibacter intestinavium]
MKVDQVLQLIQAVSDSELTEFKYEEDGVKLSLKKTEGKIVQVQAPVAAPALVQAAPAVIPAAPGAVPAAQGTTPGTPSAAPAPSAEAPAAGEVSATGADALPAGNVVKSPLVGTFYAAPAEDAEPFVKVGDSVKEGQVLAIVEAMKLMNEIESDFTGTVAEILVENGEAVEFGQPLFVIK